MITLDRFVLVILQYEHPSPWSLPLVHHQSTLPLTSPTKRKDGTRVKKTTDLIPME